MNKIVRSLLMKALDVIKKEEEQEQEEHEVEFDKLSNEKKKKYIKTILKKIREANDNLEKTILNVVNNNSFIFLKFGLDKPAKNFQKQISLIALNIVEAIEKILFILEENEL